MRVSRPAPDTAITASKVATTDRLRRSLMCPPMLAPRGAVDSVPPPVSVKLDSDKPSENVKGKIDLDAEIFGNERGRGCLVCRGRSAGSDAPARLGRKRGKHQAHRGFGAGEPLLLGSIHGSTVVSNPLPPRLGAGRR